MKKTISEPKNVQIKPNGGGTPGIVKMEQKRVVADFATYTAVVNALSQPSTHKDSLKKVAGDKNMTPLTKSTDSLTEAIQRFGLKHGFGKIIEALDTFSDEAGDLGDDEFISAIPPIGECGTEPVAEEEEDLPDEL